MDIGTKIKEARKKKELSLVQLSNVCSISPSHIGRIENSERRPSGYSLKALAEPLGISEVELFKAAGLLSKDATDDRAKKLLREIEWELQRMLVSIERKIESL